MITREVSEMRKWLASLNSTDTLQIDEFTVSAWRGGVVVSTFTIPDRDADVAVG